MDNRKMIYLDDAIDAVSKACQEWRGIFGRCEDALLALPSAQPEPCEKDIIGMIKKYTNCPVSECKKAFDIGIDYLRSKSRVRGGKDTVSRQSEVVMCKDCIHRPIIDDPDIKDGFGLLFPDFRCPCRCDDPYYSWMPNDNWFCGNGEKEV